LFILFYNKHLFFSFFWAYQLKKVARFTAKFTLVALFLTVGLFVASPQQAKLAHYLLVGYPLLSLTQISAVQYNLNFQK
jgi:hypothetical protein